MRLSPCRIVLYTGNYHCSSSSSSGSSGGGSGSGSGSGSRRRLLMRLLPCRIMIYTGNYYCSSSTVVVVAAAVLSRCSISGSVGGGSGRWLRKAVTLYYIRVI